VLVGVGKGVLVDVGIVVGGVVAVIVAVGGMLVTSIAGVSVGVGAQAESTNETASRKNNGFSVFIRVTYFCK